MKTKELLERLKSFGYAFERDSDGYMWCRVPEELLFEHPSVEYWIGSLTHKKTFSLYSENVFKKNLSSGKEALLALYQEVIRGKLGI